MKILLGGIPLGCDNIGDEAIIACVVKMLRRNFPAVSLTVCTRDPATGGRLGVNCASLYGFDADVTLDDFGKLAASHDAYIWCGATGLSDYPAAALALLRAARRRGVPTFIWGVGMDSELNPAFFKLGGRRKKLLTLVGKIGGFDAVGAVERHMAAAMRQKIKAELEQCRLVVVRDEPSALELRRCGFNRAIVGADTAILLESEPSSATTDESSGRRRLGFCISAQRALKQADRMLELWEKLLTDAATDLVLIPMNPKTDSKLMAELAAKLPSGRDRVEMVDAVEPSAVQSIAGSCAAVVSSRLHLLILSGNTGTPIVGVERGSKIANYLALYGLKPCGTVFDCDFSAIEREINRLTADGGAAFRAKANEVRSMLTTRLTAAEQRLAAELRKLSNTR